MKKLKIITLDDDYSIEMEGINVTLRYEKAEGEVNPKTGKPKITKKTRHYSTIGQALKQYVQFSAEGCNDVREILVKMDEIYKVIDNLKI